jgi:hypothetical protein
MDLQREGALANLQYLRHSQLLARKELSFVGNPDF